LLGSFFDERLFTVATYREMIEAEAYELFAEMDCRFNKPNKQLFCACANGVSASLCLIAHHCLLCFA
jgi:hypothetical protein